MDCNFLKILSEHSVRYPLMQIQDYVKLAYQSELGPQHLVADAELHSAIKKELETLPNIKTPYCSEYIGNGLHRFSLSELHSADLDVLLLTDLLVRTAESHRGSLEGLEFKLKQVETQLGPDAVQWLDTYRAQGYPPVHHSESYRTTYCPHYRLIKSQYSNYFPILSAIQLLLSQKPSVVIAIDGLCGSGKSSLASLIATVFPCNVFHMDDFYLPAHRRAPDWNSTPAGNMDLHRFKEEVLLPSLTGECVVYRPFDCQSQCLTQSSFFLPKQLTVIEGTYSHHPLLSEQYDLKIILTCAPHVQRERLVTRENGNIESFLTHWIPLEERYFSKCKIEKENVLILDTSNFI